MPGPLMFTLGNDSFCFAFPLANSIIELFGGSNGHRLQWSPKLLWRVISIDREVYRKAFIKYSCSWKDVLFS